MDETAVKAPISVRAAQVAPLLTTASEAGVDVAMLLRSLGLQSTNWSGDQLIGLGDYFRLQDRISAALGDETFHLSSRQLLPGTTDFVMARLTGAASLHDAMKILAKSYNLLHGGEFNSVRRRGDAISFIIDDRRFPYTVKDQPGFLHFSLECVQIFLHCMLMVVSSAHAAAGLRRVGVIRAARSSDSVHLEFWRAPIRFGAPVYSLDYDLEVSNASIAPPRGDALNAAQVYAQITAAAASPRGRGGETSEFVRQSLARGVIDQTRIAALAGISAASLRRRLDAEGGNFRELRKEVLNAAARSMLKRQISVTEVAEKLGFSDFRAFNRAFKAWNGITPKAFSQTPTAKAD